MFIYTKEEIREADRTAEEKGLSAFTLMESAGAGLYRELSKIISRKDKVLIAAGKGSNGGDGIVLARYLLQNGFDAELYLPFGQPEADKPAGLHFQCFLNFGFSSSSEVCKADVIVDALFGIGFRHPLKESARKVIQMLNERKGLKISIDLPSGAEADTGEAEGAFIADYTFCLHGYKPSAFSLPSSTCYGETSVIDIGLPQTGSKKVWTDEDAVNSMPRFEKSAHKGTFGTGYIIAGSDQMPGSALLAAKSALRCGIGKLTVGTTRFAAGILAGEVPETTYEFDGLDKTAAGFLPDNIKAAAIGPGLGQGDAIERAVQVLLQQEIPVVLDADALQKRTYPNRKNFTLLTPHPGELSRMTGLEVSEIQSKRIDTALHYAKESQTAVLLKGNHTVIAFPDGEVIVNRTGNSALGKGGSGDTLTGMLTAFLCTHSSEKEAVANAVFIHGLTADAWVEEYGERTMTASDISDMLPIVLKKLERRNE